MPAIPAPATIPVRGVVVSERYAKEREVIESIDEKTSAAETILNAVLNAVAAALIEKMSIDENMPAGGRGADKAVSTWDEYLPASEHATSGHAAIDESMPAGEGGADKAVSTGDEHAPAGDHAASESAAAEMHATSGHAAAAAAEMHATSGHAAAAEMHATSGHAAAGVLRHGWRRKGNCRSKYGRGEAAEEFAFHDSDPP